MFVNDLSVTSEELKNEINRRVYSLDEVNVVKYNKEKVTSLRKKTLGEKLRSLGDLSLKYYIYIVGSIAAFMGLSSLVNALITSNSGLSTSLTSNVISALIMVACALVINHFTQFKSRVKIQFKDNKVYDMIVLNSDVSFVKSYLNRLHVQ